MFVRFEHKMPTFGEKVLILFENSGHIEDATIHQDTEGSGWIYALFDGEILNYSPSHWAPMPDIED